MERGRGEVRRVTGRRSAAQWRKLTAEQESSGEGVGAFAASRGVNPTTLSWWKCEFRRRDAAVLAPAGTPKFVELATRTAARLSAVGFEAVLRSGVVLRAAADADAEAFARFAAALDRAC